MACHADGQPDRVAAERRALGGEVGWVELDLVVLGEDLDRAPLLLDVPDEVLGQVTGRERHRRREAERLRGLDRGHDPEPPHPLQVEVEPAGLGPPAVGVGDTTDRLAEVAHAHEREIVVGIAEMDHLEIDEAGDALAVPHELACVALQRRDLLEVGRHGLAEPTLDERDERLGAILRGLPHLHPEVVVGHGDVPRADRALPILVDEELRVRAVKPREHLGERASRRRSFGLGDVRVVDAGQRVPQHDVELGGLTPDLRCRDSRDQHRLRGTRLAEDVVRGAEADPIAAEVERDVLAVAFDVDPPARSPAGLALDAGDDAARHLADPLGDLLLVHDSRFPSPAGSRYGMAESDAIRHPADGVAP